MINKFKMLLLVVVSSYTFGLTTMPVLSEQIVNSCSKGESMEVFWSPAETIALIIGVLHWSDKNFASYDSENRQDERLYNILLERGVKAENLIFLKDEDATRERIIECLKTLAKKGNSNSTFLFYYAGHGDRVNQGKDTYFANFDCNSNDYPKTGFSLNTISEVLKNSFQGRQAILIADCCYSGNLNKEADKLADYGIQTLVLTSAVSSNYSTGNWTFTRSLYEILSGDPMIALTKTNISATDAASYINYNMTYAEKQLANFYKTSGFPENYVLAQAKSHATKEQNLLGKYRLITWKSKEYVCRVIKQQGHFCRIHYLNCDSIWDEWREESELKEIKFAVYDLDSKVEVEWTGDWYPAKILNIDRVFHFIDYDDYEDYWNEWVTSDRIRQK